MNKCSICKVLERVKQEQCENLIYTTSGWVRTVRTSSQNMGFCQINDGSTTHGLQIIISDTYCDNHTDFLKNVKTGMFISVQGTVVESPGSGQSHEMLCCKFEIIGNIDESYPLAKSRMNMDTLRNFIHLRPRTNVFGCIFRIRSTLTKAIHDFYHEHSFLHLDPNIITVNECEGGAGVFQITENDISDLSKLPQTKEQKYNWQDDHFNSPAYLTVSSQLQLECMACSMGNVYTMNKSFRSEHSSTSKHVSEFTHLEIEMMDNDFDALMNIGEDMIKYCILVIKDKNKDDLSVLDNFISKGILERLDHMFKTPFIKKTYSEVVQEINEDRQHKKTKIAPLNFGDDLSSEHENYITEKYNTGVYVTHWPMEIKSFYMKQCDDSTLCESFDLLMPYGIGELIGGSQREEDYDKLVNMMDKKGVSMEKLSFYTDLRKYGTVPHGGFGLGFDRLLMLLTGIKSIKDVIPFPIYYKNCKF